MNKELAKTAAKKWGGYYKPKTGDERWKHGVADQLNNLLVLLATKDCAPAGSDLREILERVSTFEEIPYHEK